MEWKLAKLITKPKGEGKEGKIWREVKKIIFNNFVEFCRRIEEYWIIEEIGKLFGKKGLGEWIFAAN